MFPRNAKDMLNVTQARQLSSTMFNNMSQYFPQWKLLASLISPHRFSETAFTHNKGIPSHKRIVKTEPTLAFQIFKSGLTNGTTPKGRKWFKYTHPNPLMGRVKKIQDYLAHTTEISEMMLHMSNFYRVMPEANADMGLFSNAAFMQLPDPKHGVYFYPFQAGTYAFQANIKGDVEMFTRKFSMTVMDFVKEFGSLKGNGHIEWANIPTYIKQKWDDRLYTELVFMVQLIIPNPFFNGQTPMFHSYQRKYQSYQWIDYLDPSVPSQQSTGFRNEVSEGQHKDAMNDFVSVRGFDYFPVIVPRWTVPFGHSIGCEGPGETALNSILIYQQIEKDRLLATEKMLKPPMVGPVSLKRHGASTLPGGITWIEDSAMATAGFKPAFMVDPKIAELVLNSADYKETIDSAFFKDIFLMFANQELKSHISAAETNERSAEKLSVINPMLAQYDVDVGSKVLKNNMIIGESLGVMPPRPKELEGTEVSAEYMSILANASKASLLNSIERTMNFQVQAASALQNPLLLHVLKGEDVVKAYADYAGLDPRFIASDRELQEVARRMQEQQAQQAQLDQQLKVSEITRNMSASGENPAGSHLATMSAASSV